jgi:hypothetical protein
MADKLTVLFLAANPEDTDQLKLDEEMRAIDLALRESTFRDRFDLRSAWALRYGDLQALLLRHEPHIVHFSGHGSERGEIAVKSESGAARLVPPEALAGLFEILKDNIRCVVLNACYSEVQAVEIAKVIDCVVGMERAVSDSAAIDFAAGFYLGLGYGRSVKTAFDMGRNRIGLAGGTDGAIPKLLAPNIDAAKLVLVNAASGKPVDKQADKSAEAPTASAPSTSNSAGGDFISTVVGAGAQNVAVGKNIQQTVNPAAPGAAGKLPSKLSGRQYAEFQAAVLSAYNLDSLRQMVRVELDTNLDAVAGGANLGTVIFNLIDWAQRTGRLPQLIQGALDGQPDNTDLQTFVTNLR